MTKAQRFFSDIQDKKVAFIGTGVSHNELIKLFLQRGINVVICDRKSYDDFPRDIYDDFTSRGAKFELGDGYLEAIFDCDIVFRTPGMYFNHPTLIKAREQGIIVTSEMEVFFDLCPCKILAVTGSDGKTTTTSVICELLKEEGKRVHLGGNIGKALLPSVEIIAESDYAVVELSSFQLISMRCSPWISVITNITPNHLDVHGTMEEYIEAKTNILRHQNAFSKTVLNYDNEKTMKLKSLIRGRCRCFSRKGQPQSGAFLREDGMLCYNHYGSITEIMHKDCIRIPGIHNVENYLAAITAVWEVVSCDTIKRVAENFGGVEHRIEFVRERNGVKWYNDSIATSPTRVLAGLNSFSQKLIVIAGGYDKKIPFEPLAKPVNEKVKVLILMGVTADKIEKAVTECDEYNPETLKIIKANSMKDAVELANGIAHEGDIVTLSPACASFDLYPNFEARGNHYKRIVNELV